MYGIPKNKRKITPQIARRILEEYADNITAEDTEIILEFMYNFAKLALNQQLQRRSEGQDRLIHILDQDKKA
jgi:hypothetical protein